MEIYEEIRYPCLEKKEDLQQYGKVLFVQFARVSDELNTLKAKYGATMKLLANMECRLDDLERKGKSHHAIC